MAKKSSENGWRRRLHPKLRMIRNGDSEVNSRRAELSSCVTLKTAKPRELPMCLAAEQPDADAAPAKKKTRAKLKAPASDVIVNVYIESREAPKVALTRREGTLSVANVALNKLEAIASDEENVTFIQQAETLKFARPQKSSARGGEPSARAKSAGLDALRAKHKGGKGVIIGIVDVDGFDYEHDDFRDSSGETRFVRIWDQGAEPGPRSSPPGKRFNYGNELDAKRLNKALASAKKVKVSAHDIEPQSQMSPGSHGTHVASIAAGRSGMCPNAEIAAVLISLPPEDPDARRGSFYDSTRLLDAIEYLLDYAEQQNKPISINVSLGTNGHAHDGSSPLDRWIDAWLARPGRSICVAAGNAGQEKEETPGDLGYIFGRIHTSGQIGAKDLVHDLEWEVAGNRIMDISENELEIWYESQDRFAVDIRPPGGSWLGQPIEPGEFLENFELSNQTFLSIYNELYHPANGHNYISVFLSPRMKKPIVGITAGVWTVRLIGRDVRDGRFHGWIERDDPVQIDEKGYFFPSYFTERSNVDSASVSSLACGERIISVANLDEARECINISSSQGPTRTGGLKPDVAAPGTGVIAANGFGRADKPWIAMTGTSMASPYVAGVIGLMLATERRLGAAQINGILKATAQPLPSKGFAWLNDCGFGKINAAACVRQAVDAFERTDVKGRYA